MSTSRPGRFAVSGFLLLLLCLAPAMQALPDNGRTDVVRSDLPPPPNPVPTRPAEGAAGDVVRSDGTTAPPTTVQAPPPPQPRPPTPSPVAAPTVAGRSLAVVSNTDPQGYKLLREWAGQEDSIEYLLEPSGLDDLGRKLETLGRARKVSKLIFLGHGTASTTSIFFIRTPTSTVDSLLTAQSFNTLAGNRPDLAKAFAPGAELVFFNCLTGQNTALMQAAGRAFLGAHGGVVVANKNLTRYFTSRDADGNLVIDWMDAPGWYRVPWFTNFPITAFENVHRWFKGWTSLKIAGSHHN